MSKVVSITTLISTSSAASRRRVASIPSDPWHAHVHEDDVRLQAQRLRHGVRAVSSLAGDLDVLLSVEDHAKASSHERLIVDDENAEAHRPTFLMTSPEAS